MNSNGKRWRNSVLLLQRAKNSLTGGVSSPFRAKLPVPLFFQDACGSRLWDVDNNEYIDYALAWGPLILGHRHPALVKAMRKAATMPHNYGAQHELEYLAAEKAQSLIPCAERVLFTSSGSEAVQIALRLARAFTSRETVVKFEGHYHGWIDSVLFSNKPTLKEAGPIREPRPILGSSGQSKNCLKDIQICSWNRVDLLSEVFERRPSKIAAVIMEPVLCNSGCLLPKPDYLRQVKELCRKNGAVLIFDEVITGCRQSLGGAQEIYEVIPDLATFGKAMGGGMPVSLTAGRKEILEQILEGTMFGGTFNGNPICLSAMRATLEELSLDDGQALEHANKMGQKLMKAFAAKAEELNIPILITGFGAAFSLHFTKRSVLRDYRDTLADDQETLQRFVTMCLEEGLYLLPDGRWYVSAVHTSTDLKQTIQIVTRVLERLGNQSESKILKSSR